MVWVGPESCKIVFLGAPPIQLLRHTCSITLDIIQITPSTTFYPNKLNVAIVYGPGLITLNFPVSMMTGILLIGCFLRHIIQSNFLCFNFSSLKCVVLMRYVIILIKLLCM